MLDDLSLRAIPPPPPILPREIGNLAYFYTATNFAQNAPSTPSIHGRT